MSGQLEDAPDSRTCPECYGPRHQDSQRWWCVPSCERWGAWIRPHVPPAETNPVAALVAAENALHQDTCTYPDDECSCPTPEGSPS